MKDHTNITTAESKKEGNSYTRRKTKQRKKQRKSI